jgi:hypothetical protein
MDKGIALLHCSAPPAQLLQVAIAVMSPVSAGTWWQAHVPKLRFPDISLIWFLQVNIARVVRSE